MNRKELFQLFKTSFKNWLSNNAPIRAAALTFFIILPLPSLLLIVVAGFALFYGHAQAIHLLIQQITALAGPAVAGLFNQLLASSTSPFSSLWVSVTTLAFSLGGAIGAFAVLRDTMDTVWEIKSTKAPSFTRMVRKRIGPFIVVSVLGLIVIAWTGVASLLFGTIKFFSVNGTLTLIVITIARILSLFGLSVLLFALTYKLIPDTKVHWRDVALASVLAGVAFTVTNYIIGTYVETFTVTTIIGAAGSLMIILLWIFILNQIMLFGAQLSKVYATTYSGEHTKQHLPQTAAKKIVKSIERAGQKIEQATKGNDTATQKTIAQKPEAEKTTVKTSIQTPKKEGRAEEKDVETKQLPMEEKTEEAEPEKPDEGKVEVTVKIKTPDKKPKSND